MTMPITSELTHDLRGAEQISAHSGHWMGGGEPCVPFSCGERTGKAGSVVSLRLALGDYHDRGPTRYRRAFNATIATWRQYPTEPLDLPDPPSTRAEQANTRFVRLTIPRYDGIDLGDPSAAPTSTCAPGSAARRTRRPSSTARTPSLPRRVRAVRVDPLGADPAGREHAR